MAKDKEVRRLFFEQAGGVIVSFATGKEAVRINVEGMIISDAMRVRNAVMAALEAEFASKPDPEPRFSDAPKRVTR